MMKSKKNPDVLKCSFCGKTQKEVLKLVAGPNVYICNDCIGLCNDILDEEKLLDSESGYESPRQNLLTYNTIDITVEQVLEWMNYLDLSDLAQIISRGARLVDNLTLQPSSQARDKINASTADTSIAEGNIDN